MRDPAASATEQHRVFTMLTAAFDDRLLAGRAEILAYLHAIGVRGLGGQRITWRRLSRWALQCGFPLLPGMAGRRWRYCAVSSVFAVQAWVLSRPRNGMAGLFAIWPSTAGAKNAGVPAAGQTAPRLSAVRPPRA